MARLWLLDSRLLPTYLPGWMEEGSVDLFTRYARDAFVGPIPFLLPEDDDALMEWEVLYSQKNLLDNILRHFKLVVFC